MVLDNNDYSGSGSLINMIMHDCLTIGPSPRQSVHEMVGPPDSPSPS